MDTPAKTETHSTHTLSEVLKKFSDAYPSDVTRQLIELYRLQNEQIITLQNTVAHLSAYKTDMEDTLGTLGKLLKASSAVALLAKAKLLHEAADNALNVLIGSCVSAGGKEDAARIAEAKLKLRAVL